jgi:hypothetical protein
MDIFNFHGGIVNEEFVFLGQIILAIFLICDVENFENNVNLVFFRASPISFENHLA